ncbi:hypothetical protein [Palleronia pelagia]|uniref:DUF3137 domain-containing protein n=1 Tax=Palleronia pelagia TaxID=387096 RepID=A0A1H8BHZ7_9RHOB|nr:hypothetical protein [Palleronia pelagia]SEM82099.1 hypothetical protein SAMN04488011_101593 [Palleronia pelagia]
MNIANQVQIIFIPVWVRVLIGLLVAGTLGVAMLLFWGALVEDTSPDWVEAGAYVLGIVFPLLLVCIIALGASFGERSIRRRTERVLTRTIPYQLQFLPEEDRQWRTFPSRRWSPRTDTEALAKVELHHSRGRCHADYRISLPGETGGHLRLRVELNVKRANVNIAFRHDHLARMAEADGTPLDPAGILRSHFQHTLEVEQIQARDAGAQGPEGRTGIAYAFNPEPLIRVVDGRTYVVLVASTRLAEDTVWNPSEKVYFAQDLMFMIRALLQESPKMFARPFDDA